ncbi:Uu.00g082760.m01.CDS01 [Anthostomella pinea]|uniref:Uu.00g082760.m01.CDS01 n=1 Tax=Anthostomella pinea TaxID=933095 RepID=A0AAI8VML5_9PEZI|nr:Uu.00g082760.m01.CDS01 [Anthostomella pinea]
MRNGKAPAGDQLITTPNSVMGVDYTDCSNFNLSISPNATSDHFMPGMSSIHYSHHHMPLSPENMDSDFLNYLPSPHMTVRNDVSHFQIEDPRHFEEITGSSATTTPLRRESMFGHTHMPSLREVRALNSSSTSTTPPPSSPTGRSHRGEDANKILAEFTSFGMTVFNTQAEIAGISSGVAEYLEWMRKAPSSAGPGGAASKANLAVLEALETRVRELHNMASTRHLEAWRQSVGMLERVEGVGAMLSLFDGEMHRRSAETAEFFQTSYDIRAPLPEQQMRKD